MRARQAVGRVALAAVAAGASPARADATVATVAAVAPADDARAAVIVGPSGQVYEPDGRGAWARHHAGGVSGDVAVAVESHGAVFAGAGDAAGAHAPPFRYSAGVWQIVPVALRAHAVVGRGTRPVAAVGRGVFVLGDGAHALPEAPGPVIRLGASPSGTAIQTEHGVFRLDGNRWTAVGQVPALAGLLDDRFAIAAAGVVDLRSNKAFSWPVGLDASSAASVDAGGEVITAATNGKAIEIQIIRGGRAEHDRLPDGVLADPLAPVAGAVLDRSGRIVLVLRDGRVAIRDNGTWTATAVRDDLPGPRPGAPPAASQ